MRKHLIITAACLPLLPIVFLNSTLLANASFRDIKTSDFKYYIEESVKKWVISGYSDNTFRPKENVSFIEALKIIINSGPKRKFLPATQNGEHWSIPFKTLYEQEDFTKLANFWDNQKVTREFVIYLLLRQNGIAFEQSDYYKFSDINFTDVNAKTPFAPYILFAKKAGIIQGNKDGTFGVGKLINRGEITKMTYNALIKNPEKIIETYENMQSFNSASETEKKPETPKIENKKIPEKPIKETKTENKTPNIEKEKIPEKIPEKTVNENNEDAFNFDYKKENSNNSQTEKPQTEKNENQTLTPKISVNPPENNSSVFVPKNSQTYVWYASDFTSVEDMKRLAKSVMTLNPEYIYPAFSAEKIMAVKRSNGEIAFFKVENPGALHLYFYENGIPFLSHISEAIFPAQIRAEMMKQINTIRRQNNLGTVRENAKLRKTAQDYAKKMYTNNFFDHTDLEWNAVWDRVEDNGYIYEFVVENIARGQRSIDQVMKEFIASPGHYANILNKNVDEVGVGFYGNYWVQVFAKEYIAE